MANSSEQPPIHPLDYRGPSPPRPKFQETPEGRRWRYRRILYRVALLPFFACIAFYFGPNEINFGKLTSLTPDDFIPTVQKDFVPVIRAIKEYQRDHGSLPNQVADVIPQYGPLHSLPMENIENKHFYALTRWNHIVTYDFTPGSEGWQVSGPLVNGPIHLGPVTLGPSTQTH